MRHRTSPSPLRRPGLLLGLAAVLLAVVALPATPASASGGATVTTITSSPSTGTVGQPVLLTATVTSSGSPVTVGTVSFTFDTAIIPACENTALNGNGQAFCHYTFGQWGTFPMGAIYADPDLNNETGPYGESEGTVNVVVPASTPYAGTAYVANSTAGTVSAVNTATNAVVATINIGTGSDPQYVAVTPNGKYAYVTDYGTSTVTVITVATNQILTTIALPAASDPMGIAIAPSGLYAYVADSGTTVNDVSVIKVATNAITTNVSVGYNPEGIAVTWQSVFVSDYAGGYVVAFSTATNTLTAVVSTGTNSDPFAIALAPNDLTAYVTDYAKSAVTPINTQTFVAATPITVGADPAGISINPDGTVALVASEGTDSLTQININTPEAADTTSTVSLASQGAAAPIGVAIAPNGANAFVTVMRYTPPDRSVIPLFLTTAVTSPWTTAAATSVAVGTAFNGYTSSTGVAVTPNPMRTWVMNPGNDTVTPITVANQTAGPPVSVPGTPVGIAVNPDDTMVVVASSGSESVAPNTEVSASTSTPTEVAPANNSAITVGAGYLTIIDTATDAVVAQTQLPADALPQSVTITNNGLFAYVTQLLDGYTEMFDLTDIPGFFLQDTSEIPGVWPLGEEMAESATTIPTDPEAVYTAVSCSSFLSLPIGDPCTGNSVYPVGGYTTVGSPATSNARCPLDLAFTPNGQKAYVADGVCGTTLNPFDQELYTYTPGSSTFGPNISLTLGTHSFPNQSLAMLPDGGHVLLAGTGVGLLAVNTTSGVAATVLPTSDNLSGVAVTPDGQTVYAANGVNNAVIPISTGGVLPSISTGAGSAPTNIATSTATGDGEIYSP